MWLSSGWCDFGVGVKTLSPKSERARLFPDEPAWLKTKSPNLVDPISAQDARSWICRTLGSAARLPRASLGDIVSAPTRSHSMTCFCLKCPLSVNNSGQIAAGFGQVIRSFVVYSVYVHVCSAQFTKKLCKYNDITAFIRLSQSGNRART